MIIIFVLLTLYLANYFKNEQLNISVFEQFDQAPSLTNEILHNQKINIDGKELYIGAVSKNIFDSGVEYIIFYTKSKYQDHFKIRVMTFLEKIFLKFSFLPFFPVLKEFYDSSIYIASDNREFHNVVSRRNAVIQIKNILKKEPLIKKSSLELYNLNNEFCMKISFKKRPKFKNLNIDEFLKIYKDDFINIFHQLELEKENQINTYKKLRSKTKNFRFVMLLVFIGGFFLSIYHSHQVFPQIIDMASLIFVSISMALIISTIILVYLFIKLKDSSFLLDIVRKYTMASIFAFSMASYYAAIYINTIFDESMAKPIIRTVIDTRKSSKGVAYYVKFNYFYAQSITGDELRVPYEIYKHKKVVTIYIKSGYLNIKYIDDIK